MTTQTELAESFRRLTAALADIEKQPDGTEPADGVRGRLAAHVDALIEGLRGTRPKHCQRHPGQLAHNCGPCRSEVLAAPDE